MPYMTQEIQAFALWQLACCIKLEVKEESRRYHGIMVPALARIVSISHMSMPLI